MEFPTTNSYAGDAEKQKWLNSALETLSLNQIPDAENFYRAIEFFESLYEGDFRHKYSDIYITMCSSDLEIEKAQERCACLSENLRLLIDGDFSEGFDEKVEEKRERLRGSSGFFKLRDHVDLEAQRNLAELSRLDGLSGKVQETAMEMKKASSELSAARCELDKAQERISHLQRETVAILGVFAAVVLVFNGSIGFSVSAIQAVGLVPSMRNIILLCLLVGFVMFNSIAVLLKFVWGITGHEVKSARELMPRKSEARTGSAASMARSCVWPYVLIPDALLVLLFVLVVSGIVSLPDAAMALVEGT